MIMNPIIHGFPAEVGLIVYPRAGHILTERMLEAQGGVGFMTWFRQPMPEYQNKTPEQLLREGRTRTIVQICNELEEIRRNGNGQH